MRARNILLVDDSDKFRTSVINSLGRAFSIVEAASENEFRQAFRPYTFDLIILDMRLDREREGLQLLREILVCDELQPIIMVSAYGDTDAVLDSAEAGALMFLHKQEFTPELLARMVEAVLQQAQIRRQLSAVQNRIPSANSLVLSGNNLAIKRAAEQVRKAASEPDCTVVVSGEWGSGHQLIAQAVHDQSQKRRTAPLVSAGAFSHSVDEMRKLIFGQPPKGKTPGSKGLLERANGGLLFIDYIECLPVDIRQSLFESLHKRMLDEFIPPIPLDIQMVASASPESASEIVNSIQSLAVTERIVEIYLPPLQERREDIPLLATSYLQHSRQGRVSSVRTISHKALDLMERYNWPGNLIELENTLEYAAIRATLAGSEVVDAEHLPLYLTQIAKEPDQNDKLDYREHLAKAELNMVEMAIAEHPGHSKKELADILGYSDRFSFGRRIRKALSEYPELASEFPLVSGWFTLRVAS